MMIKLSDVVLNISVQLTSDLAKIPTRGSNESAGYDLYSVEEYELKSMERKLFATNVKMAISKGFYGRIAPRSGLALKKGIDVMAGVIDSDYRGEIGVLIINLSAEPVKISVGDKIAQIIFEKCFDASLEVVQDLSKTERNDGGFGSTDEKNYIKRDGGFVHPNKKEIGGLIDLFKKSVPSSQKVDYEKTVKEREQNSL